MDFCVITMEKTKIKMQFDPDIAKELGVECAIMFSNIDFWVDTNRNNGINLHDGYYWTFNSVTAFKKQFTFWTDQNIRTILKKLFVAGYIKKGRFNKKGYDKTSWYTVTGKQPKREEVLLESTDHLLESTNGVVSSNEPIPDNKLNIINTNTTYSIQQQEVKEEVEVSSVVTFPVNRGKNPNDRLLYLHGKLYKQNRGIDYKPNFAMDKKMLNGMLELYSEIQVGYLLCVFHNWHGVSGNDSKEYNRMCEKNFPLPLFRYMKNDLEVYARNIMSSPFDDDSKLLDEVLKILSN